MDPLEKVMVDRPENFIYASSLMSSDKKEQLRLMLLNNIDVSAWNHSDMVWISPT